MRNVEQTIISQYVNSSTIVRIVRNMDEYIDPMADLDAFYNFVWNVNTAVGFGLDIWGKIVDVGRYLKIDVKPYNFGFDDGLNDYAPFGQGVFWNGTPLTNTYRLEDEAYRTLVLAKAMANIIRTTSPAINQLLCNLFPDRGRCYVLDIGEMRMRYVFEFRLTDYERAIVNQANVLPRGAGVKLEVLEIPLPNIFGFSEQGGRIAPFGQGVFFNQSS